MDPKSTPNYNHILKSVKCTAVSDGGMIKKVIRTFLPFKVKNDRNIILKSLRLLIPGIVTSFSVQKLEHVLHRFFSQSSSVFCVDEVICFSSMSSRKNSGLMLQNILAVICANIGVREVGILRTDVANNAKLSEIFGVLECAQNTNYDRLLYQGT